MRTLVDYFSFESIVQQLASQRAKIAFHIHTHSYLDRFGKGKNYQIKDASKLRDLQLLNQILPPRKDWSRPRGYQKRLLHDSAISINESAIKNRVYQVKREIKEGVISEDKIPDWYKGLLIFISELKEKAFSANISICSPLIVAAKKDSADKTNLERRPLAKYSLEERLILSLTNKYFTAISDAIFKDCSYAFRGKERNVTYHDAVSEIQNFKTQRPNEDLFVAECDIKKFFDCVDHKILLSQFEKFKTELFQIKNLSLDTQAEKILIAYLKSYSFNKNVFGLNFEQEYWKANNDNGRFPWIENLETAFDNGLLEFEMIGIPQGGALSGFLVNILMHEADKLLTIDNQVRGYKYLRYCDDMVIVHTCPEECTTLFNKYLAYLVSVNLQYHNPGKLSLSYSRQFWGKAIKTKSLYAWSSKKSISYPNSPWISFLGYMINVNGDLKVRKKSIEKQQLKHKEETRNILKRLSSITNSDLLRNQLEIIRSFESRLFSMAVGRVDILKYKSQAPKMCWGAGFKLLENNKYSRAQLKKLDKDRKLQILKLKKYLYKRLPNLIPTDDVKNDDKRIIDAQYPHSFYSLLDRKPQEN
jgi:hypothetical protein